MILTDDGGGTGTYDDDDDDDDEYINSIYVCLACRPFLASNFARPLKS